MDREQALQLVLARLTKLSQNMSENMTTYFAARVDAAIDYLTKQGIQLDDSAGDLMLVVDLTVWQYQNRDKADGMPRWLRLRIKERWLHLREGEGGGS